MSFVIHIFLHVKCTLQTTSNVPCICTVQSTSHTCIRMYIWCTFVRSFNAHWLCDSKCTLQCVCNVHYTGTSKCAFKCTFFTMHIGGTSYALSTMYIQCTLEVVRNALNSSQIWWCWWLGLGLGWGLRQVKTRQDKLRQVKTGQDRTGGKGQDRPG